MTAETARKNARDAQLGGWRVCLLLAALAFAGTLGASGPAAGAGRQRAAKAKARGPHALATTVLTNGTGDGRISVRVDAYGGFGITLTDDDLIYDPFGAQPAAGTTFFSSVWLGTGTVGEFLNEQNLPPINFSSTTATRAVSEFVINGVRISLVQEVLPATATGSVFRQTYTLTNQTSGSISRDLIRHFDGDLEFDGSIDDGAGVSADGQLLFEFDSTADPRSATTFVGIDLNRQANLGFRIAEFDFEDDVDLQGRAVLNNSLTLDGPNGSNTADADVNNDRITDTAYDVTLSLGRSVTLAEGGSATFITNTILGEGIPAEVITAPSNLTATAVSSSQVNLTWQDNSPNETGFEIERRTGSGAFSRIATTAANATSFSDQTVAPNTTYTYRVRAVFANGGESAYSNEATVTTPAAAVLAAPSNLTATAVSSTQIRLTWRDNSTNETGFEVERNTGGEGTFERIGTVSPNTTTFNDTGLSPSNEYCYRVRAIGAGSTTSAYSNVACATTTAPGDNPPRFIDPTPANGRTFRVAVGRTVNFTVRASDPDEGENVVLVVDALPSGARHTPPLPAAGNPVSSSFSWTPQAGQEGIYELVYRAFNGELGGEGVPGPQGVPIGAETRVRILVGRLGVCADGRTGGGESVTFRGSVGWRRGSDRLIGRMTLRNRGRRATVTAVTITRLTSSGNRATIEGTAKLNGRAGHTFRMVVQDNGRRDRLESLSVDGQNWPSGDVVKGDVHFHGM
jgi:hypothetical protein